ncbi:hypothetical protein EG346_18540 [Chryseobacterium carnipullorum]|uniref:Uncharacterized protein n=1 Tax=Chryseobacterium carnipullorum TaxID=1124835 RepID=A0A3G6NA91_CHRCU|nr:hypothetical protein EG346_18540 [Chryseobacterium carnipullorum]AZA64931.1 hypothetical protein EG345_09570 [Chryseobacterium carnipullorum]
MCFFLALLSSCKSSALLESWEFIDGYDGKLTAIDTLKTKKNNSRYGKGMLVFDRDNSFISPRDKGK